VKLHGWRLATPGAPSWRRPQRVLAAFEEWEEERPALRLVPDKKRARTRRANRLIMEDHRRNHGNPRLIAGG